MNFFEKGMAANGTVRAFDSGKSVYLEDTTDRQVTFLMLRKRIPSRRPRLKLRLNVSLIAYPSFHPFYSKPTQDYIKLDRVEQQI